MVMAERPAPQMRIATPTDAAAIDALMKASTRELFPAYYTPEQTASSIVHIARMDPMLLEDGTYFALEADGELVACGGWSRRDKLYSGSAEQEGRDRLLDPATEAAHVRAMFVRSDWTRRGLGTRILDACEAAAQGEGFRRLSLGATLPGYPLYVRFGFVEVEDITFGERSAVVVDPSEEKVKAEFEGVARTYLPMHSIIRIDEVRKEGVSKVSDGSNVMQFPVPIYTPGDPVPRK